MRKISVIVACVAAMLLAGTGFVLTAMDRDTVEGCSDALSRAWAKGDIRVKYPECDGLSDEELKQTSIKQLEETPEDAQSVEDRVAEIDEQYKLEDWEQEMVNEFEED